MKGSGVRGLEVVGPGGEEVVGGSGVRGLEEVGSGGGEVVGDQGDGVRR